MRFVKLTMVDPKQGKFTKMTSPVMVNMDYVRAFYPRKGDIGTRLTFVDGNGFAVTEEFKRVRKMLSPRRKRSVAPRRKVT